MFISDSDFKLKLSCDILSTHLGIFPLINWDTENKGVTEL